MVGSNLGKVTVTCFKCGKEFDRYSYQIKEKNYCSYECVGNAKKPKIKKICEKCGKDFYIFESRAHQKFCSRECAGLGIRGKNLIENYTERICATCGKKFKVYIPLLKYAPLKYCSIKCARTTHGKSIKRKLICPKCGKEFVGNGYRKFCSRKCSSEWISINLSGANSPHYNGGKREYCEKWNKNFRERIRAFFGNTCINCGSTQEKTLRCHHVYYDKTACCSINNDNKYLSNLGLKNEERKFEIVGDPNKFVPLCERCHNSTNGNFENRSKWARYFEKIINEQYNGRCYFTKEEYKKYMEKQ